MELNVDTETTHLPALSILPLLRNLPVASKLQKIIDVCGAQSSANEMPKTYNGDLLFEFPPSSTSSMEGMHRAFDCHFWIRYTTSTIQGFPGVVRLSNCGGGFECQNDNCSYLLSFGRKNSRHFIGRLKRRSPIGLVTNDVSSMKCRSCNHPPYCMKHCAAKIYYCIPNDTRYSRLVIHSGFHDHDFGDGESYANVQKAEDLVGKMAHEDKRCKPQRIQKDIAKELIADHLLATTSSSTPIDATKLDDLLSLLQPTTNNRRCGKYSLLLLDVIHTLSLVLLYLTLIHVLVRLKKWITQARKELQPIDLSQEITSFLYLKEHCAYQYFHGSLFPGQLHDTNDRCHIFKMSTTGPASGVELVKRMKPGNDLERSWCCFDHVHRIKEWVTMAAHVYDIRYIELLVAC